MFTQPYVPNPYVSYRYVSYSYVSYPYVSYPYVSNQYMSNPYVSNPYVSNPNVLNPYVSSLYFFTHMFSTHMTPTYMFSTHMFLSHMFHTHMFPPPYLILSIIFSLVGSPLICFPTTSLFTHMPPPICLLFYMFSSHVCLHMLVNTNITPPVFCCHTRIVSIITDSKPYDIPTHSQPAIRYTYT